MIVVGNLLLLYIELNELLSRASIDTLDRPHAWYFRHIKFGTFERWAHLIGTELMLLLNIKLRAIFYVDARRLQFSLLFGLSEIFGWPVPSTYQVLIYIAGVCRDRDTWGLNLDFRPGVISRSYTNLKIVALVTALHMAVNRGVGTIGARIDKHIRMWVMLLQ